MLCQLIAAFICILFFLELQFLHWTVFPEGLLRHLHTRYAFTDAGKIRIAQKNFDKNRSPKWNSPPRTRRALPYAATDFSENLTLMYLLLYLSRIRRHCLFELGFLFVDPQNVTCQDADAFPDSRHEVIRPDLVPLSYCDVTRNISSEPLRNARWSLQKWWAQHLAGRAIILNRPNHVRGLQKPQEWLPCWYELLCNSEQRFNDRGSSSTWSRDFIFATAQDLYRNDAELSDSGYGRRGRRQLVSMNCRSQESWKWRW
jgi:hypothetical protein